MIEQLQKLAMNSGSLVPILNVASKRSVTGWDQYQTEAATIDEVKEWEASGEYEGYALMMGYGDYHVVDFDQKNVLSGSEVNIFRHSWEGIPNDLRTKLVVQRTQNGGEHILYRCQVPVTKERLVINQNGKPVVETVGARNYLLISPSPGYEIVSGSLSEVQYISEVEHQWLQNHCRKVGNEAFGSPEHGTITKSKTKADKRMVSTSPKKKSSSKNHRVIRAVADMLESNGKDITGDYEDWIKLGFAIANEMAEDGRECYHKISGNHPEYDSTVTNEKYDSFLKEQEGSNVATIGSIYEILLKNNIEPPKLRSNSLADKTETIIKHIQSKELTRDQFTNKVEWSNGTPIADSDIDDFFLEMRLKNIAASKNEIGSVVNSKVIPRSNPPKEFLLSAERYAIDGIINELLGCFKFKTNDPDEVDFYSGLIIKWLLQIPAIVLDGKCPRLLLVLIGDTYIGKSEFFRRLLPAEMNRYYAESTLDQGKDSEILMSEHLLINVDELAGIMKSPRDVERFKALASQQSFTLRAPYGKINERYKRRAVLCGTSNRSDVIQDHDTGNSRVIPIELVDIDKDKYNSIDRRALFGALTKMYRSHSSECTRLTSEELDTLKQRSKEFTSINVEEELILRFYEPAPARSDNFQPVTQIHQYLSHHTKHPISAKKISRELRNLGFAKARKRVGGSNLHGFNVHEKMQSAEGLKEKLNQYKHQNGTPN